MARKTDARYPAITTTLAESGYLQTHSPMLMKPDEYLDTLASAQIPLTLDLVANCIDSWLANERDLLLERLLQNGEGVDLLIIVVKYFLSQQFRTVKEINPLDVIKGLITSSLISRMPLGDKGWFVYQLIGNHNDIPSYVSDADLEPEDSGDDEDDALNRLLYYLFGSDDINNDDSSSEHENNKKKVFPGLRGYVSLGLIEAYQIEELEEWLWKEFDIPSADHFRQTSTTNRDTWLTELQKQSSLDSVDEPVTDDYLIKNAADIFTKKPLHALFFLESVQDIVRAMSFCPIYTDCAVKKGQREGASQVVSRLFDTLMRKLPTLNETSRKAALSGLLETVVILADVEKVVQVIRMLNESGLEKLLIFLNIDVQTLGHYFIQVYGENPSVTGNTVSNNSLKGLVKMLNALTKRRKNSELLEGLFGELLCLRLYYKGEDGVVWPSKNIWEKHPDIILNMACRVGVSPANTDDEKEARKSLFLLWLSRARQHLAPAIVPQIVGRVMAETIVLTGETEDK